MNFEHLSNFSTFRLADWSSTKFENLWKFWPSFSSFYFPSFCDLYKLVQACISAEKFFVRFLMQGEPHRPPATGSALSNWVTLGILRWWRQNNEVNEHIVLGRNGPKFKLWCLHGWGYVTVIQIIRLMFLPISILRTSIKMMKHLQNGRWDKMKSVVSLAWWSYL